MLESLGSVQGSSVLDLFTGSGALAIESLSRGAARAVLVDTSAEAVSIARANLAVLGDVAERATVVRSEAERFVRDRPGRFDLVFADPPYAYSGWAGLLDRLLPRTGLLVAETGSPWDPGAGWETVKVRNYGGTVVTIAQPANPDRPAGGQEGES